MAALVGWRPLSAIITVALALLAAAAAPARPAAAASMTFRVIPTGDPAHCGGNCVDAIVANGEIVDSTPTEFENFLRSNMDDPRLRLLMFLNSPGGKVMASMQLGAIMRASGVAVIVGNPQFQGRGKTRSQGRYAVTPGYCFSACVYALMGGRIRVVPANSVAGIHEMFENGHGLFGANQEKVYDNGDVTAALEAYAAKMGVSPQLIAKAQTISWHSIHILSAQELRRWRLAEREY